MARPSERRGPLVAACVFAGALLIGLLTPNLGDSVRIVVVISGLIGAVVLGPPVGRRVEGSASLPGVRLQFNVQNPEPVAVHVPEGFSDSTSSRRAKELCDRGREILRSAGRAGGTSDDAQHVVDAAASDFEEALVLDPEYWEAQVNLANVRVLQGRMDEAMALVSQVRLRHHDNSTAIAKAACVEGQVVQSALPPTATETERHAFFRDRVVPIFEAVFKRRTDHVLANTTYLQALILADSPESEVMMVLAKMGELPQTRQSLKRILCGSSDIQRALRQNYPNVLEVLGCEQPADQEQTT